MKRTRTNERPHPARALGGSAAVSLGALVALVAAFSAGACVGDPATAQGGGGNAPSTSVTTSSGGGSPSSSHGSGGHMSTGPGAGGAGGSGGSGGSAGGTPVVVGAPGTAITAGGTLSQSASYKLIGAVGESPGGQTESVSQQHGAHTGLLGTTE